MCELALAMEIILGFRHKHSKIVSENYPTVNNGWHWKTKVFLLKAQRQSDMASSSWKNEAGKQEEVQVNRNLSLGNPKC